MVEQAKQDRGTRLTDHDSIPLLYPILILGGIASLLLVLAGFVALSDEGAARIMHKPAAAPENSKKPVPPPTDRPPAPSRVTGPAAG